MEDNKIQGFPYEFREIEPHLAEKRRKLFTGEQSGNYRVGPKGYFLPKRYKEDAAKIYNMKLRSSDIFVVTYPRSGTTWVQELVWLVVNDVNFEDAAKTPLIQRFPFLEFSTIMDNLTLDKLIQNAKGDETTIKELQLQATPLVDSLDEAPTPRTLKSHLPLSLLPPGLLDTSKVVYLARDPRDVVVSYYHHNRLLVHHGFVGDLKTYLDIFLDDQCLWSPYFEHIKEAWEKRDHPNMFFIFYEDVKKDLPTVLRRIAKFFGKQLTDHQIEQLRQHLDIKNFKNNKSVNLDFLKDIGFVKNNEEAFIRKGEVGGWRECFDDEMKAKTDRWMAKNLCGMDIRFPE